MPGGQGWLFIISQDQGSSPEPLAPPYHWLCPLPVPSWKYKPYGPETHKSAQGGHIQEARSMVKGINRGLGPALRSLLSTSLQSPSLTSDLKQPYKQLNLLPHPWVNH